MTELSKEQKYIILALIGILISGLAYTVYNNFSKGSSPEIIIAETENTKPASVSSPPEFVIVHLSGAVAKQGVFKLKKGSRLIDAIKVAGGIISGADLDKVNLAQELKDGIKINIPLKAAKSISPKALSKETSSKNTSSNIININTATVKELTKVKGIGKTIAQRIIEYREKNGSFSKIEDLTKVKGIGKGKFEKIKGEVRVY